jgi:hypothetical protein
LIAGGVLVTGAIIAMILLLRSGDTKSPAGVPPATAEGSDDGTTQLAAPVAVEAPPRALSAEVNQTAAVEQLRRQFGKARLYSQISVVGDQLELRSTSCEDKQLVDRIEEARPLLTESGLRHVRCLQPHGQVVFSRDF